MLPPSSVTVRTTVLRPTSAHENAVLSKVYEAIVQLSVEPSFTSLSKIVTFPVPSS